MMMMPPSIRALLAHARTSLALQLLLLFSFYACRAQAQGVMSNFDVIEHFSKNYDIQGLHSVMSRFFQQTERNMDASQIKSKLSEEVNKKGGGLHYTTKYKLQHDLEQAEYLARTLQNTTEADYFRHAVAPIYRTVLSHVPEEEGNYFFQEKDYQAGISSVYNKALHVTDFTQQQHDITSLINENLDTETIERQWFGEEQGATSGIVVVDNVLTPQALERVRQVMLESTVWYETKTLKEGGYVGAYIDDGLYDRILMAVAFDLHKALPRIMQEHALRYMWAYKYDERYNGIRVHADDAAVNVNLWLTPDDANLDESSGGLVVFTVKPPESWDFTKYNNDQTEIDKLLKATNYANVTVPYRQNRAVIFDSALFHKTDDFHFKKGYENRRINLTILYGKMRRGGGGPGNGKNEL